MSTADQVNQPETLRCAHCHNVIYSASSGDEPCWVHTGTMLVGCVGVSATPCPEPPAQLEPWPDPVSAAEWTVGDVFPLLEWAMRQTMLVGCDCDRTEVDICAGACLGSQIWNAIHRARKILRSSSADAQEEAQRITDHGMKLALMGSQAEAQEYFDKAIAAALTARSLAQVEGERITAEMLLEQLRFVPDLTIEPCCESHMLEIFKTALVNANADGRASCPNCAKMQQALTQTARANRGLEKQCAEAQKGREAVIQECAAIATREKRKGLADLRDKTDSDYDDGYSEAAQLIETDILALINSTEKGGMKDG